MRVLISGAGIAGLTLAFWLRKSGHEAVVIEKANDIRTEGYMIDFGGTGWDVADRMGLIDDLQARKHAIETIKYKNPAGDTTSQITLSKIFKAAGVEGKFMVINRRDIVRVLYEAVRADVDIRFDVSVARVCQSLDGVSVTFEDGSSESFDALIGADGIHSNVRRLSFGEEAAFTRYLGYQFAVFLAPSLDFDLEDSFNLIAEPGYQFGMYPYTDSEWMIYIVMHSDDDAIPPRAERAARLRAALPGDSRIINALLEPLDDDAYIFMDSVKQVNMPAWSNNRVGLIGDAAYCPTLISGQGASMAMAGAYLLAEELDRAESPQQAMRNYEQRLRPHIEKIHQSARDFAPNFVPQSRLRLQTINWVLRLSDVPLVRNLIGKQLVLHSIIDAV